MNGSGANAQPQPLPTASPPSGDSRPRMSAAGGEVRAPRPQPSAEANPSAVARLATFADIIARAGAERDLKLKHALETGVRLIRFEPGRIEMELTDDAPAGFAGDLSKRLEEWTGERWMIAVARDGGEPTVAEARRSARARLVSDARADPVVAAVMERFPGAEIVNVRVRADGPATTADDAAPPPADETAEEEN